MKIITLCVLALSLCCQWVQAQKPTKTAPYALTPVQQARMDSLFELIATQDKGMGSVSVFRKGQEIYRRSYGWASLDRQIKATAQTRYRIGSMSKMFTATIVLKLVEANKLSLETKLSDFYPQIAHAEAITVRHLLTHRSGIANFTDLPDYPVWKDSAQSEQAMLQKIAAMSADFEPDTRFGYSNTNYVLLSYIVQRVGKASYADLLDLYIVKPCQLRYTGMGTSIDVARGDAQSYTRMMGWLPDPVTHSSVTLGAGAIYSTATDLNQFLYCLFQGKLLKAPSLALIKSFRDGHSTGFQEFVQDELKGIGHGGRIDGFQSYGSYFLDHDLSVTFTSNAVRYPMYDIWTGMLNILFERPYALPIFAQPTPAALHSYAGSYTHPQFPFAFQIRVWEKTLLVEAEGQKFELEYVKDRQFKFDLIGLVLEFDPEQRKMLFKQNGGEFEFSKN